MPDKKTIPIYVLAWHRPDMTTRCLRELSERTRYPFEIHLWINSAWSDDVDLPTWAPYCTSIHLDKRNTCTWYPKGVQHMMTPADTPYYVLNDQDYMPPLLPGKCWLERMLDVMECEPGLGVLGAQLPPQFLAGPITKHRGFIECKAVGNALRLTRRVAWPQYEFQQELGEFGDDSILCEAMRTRGFHTGFSDEVYCLHLGQCENWGYTDAEVAEDPRKSGYGKPFTYEYDHDTYVPLKKGYRL